MNESRIGDSATAGTYSHSIVIPVYNEEEVIGSFLDEIRSFTDSWESDYELLLIDDGSSDRTPLIIADRFANWPQGRLIRLERNSGQAAALFHGMKSARGKIVVLMDGDGQNDPRDIPKIVAPLDQCDMVIGIRVNRQDSFVRRKMSRLANSLRGRILKDGADDTGCGIKAFHRRVIESFIPIRTLYSFIPALAVSAGFSLRQIPVHHRARQGGKSKYGVRQFLWRPLLDLFGIWWFSRRRCPLVRSAEGKQG
jgi:dolichol-phosphate mannosyltransferase